VQTDNMSYCCATPCRTSCSLPSSWWCCILVCGPQCLQLRRSRVLETLATYRLLPGAVCSPVLSQIGQGRCLTSPSDQAYYVQLHAPEDDGARDLTRIHGNGPPRVCMSCIGGYVIGASRAFERKASKMRSHASRGSPALSLLTLWTFYSGTYSLSCFAGLSNSRPRPLHLLPQAASTVLQSGLGSAIPNKVLHVSLLSPRRVGAVWPEQKQQANSQHTSQACFMFSFCRQSPRTRCFHSY
jgi:hypothetical protein